MGNQLSSTIQSRQFNDQSLKDFEYQAVFVEEIEDKCFGQIKIYKRRNTLNTNVFIMEKSTYNDQKVEFAQLYAESQARLELTHKNLLQFLGYDFVNQKDFCATSLRSKLFFEYFYHDLQQEIQRRSDCQEYFNEDELWYMLDSIVQVCSFLQDNQLFHGDLRPQSIKLTPEGFAKIGDHGLINPLKNGFYKTLIRSENGYLSPEQLSYLMLGLTEVKYNVFKQEVFTLGLTMLECSTLKESSQVYDWDKMLVNVDTLKQLIDFASNFYSQEYIAILNLMLQLEDAYRPDFLQLNTYVKNESASRVGGNTVTPNINQQQGLAQMTNPISKASTQGYQSTIQSGSGNTNPLQQVLITSGPLGQTTIPSKILTQNQGFTQGQQINSTIHNPQVNSPQQLQSTVLPQSYHNQYVHQNQLQQTVVPPNQLHQTVILPNQLHQTVIPPTHLQQSAISSVHHQQPIILPPPTNYSQNIVPANTVIVNSQPIMQQPEYGSNVYVNPNQNIRQSQVVVSRQIVSTIPQNINTLPVQTVIQPHQIYSQQTLSPQPRIMTSNTYITNQIPLQQQSYQKQDTFGNYTDDYNQNKKSVKFNENIDINSENYRFQGSHQTDYSQLKRSQIQFNTDLDRRVSEALEMTRQTIKKNQSVPNIFAEDSPIKKFEHKQ